MVVESHGVVRVSTNPKIAIKFAKISIGILSMVLIPSSIFEHWPKNIATFNGDKQ
jgi:hypothetical protein